MSARAILGSPLRHFSRNSNHDNDGISRSPATTPPGSPLGRLFFSSSRNDTDFDDAPQTFSAAPPSPLHFLFPFSRRNSISSLSPPPSPGPRSFSTTLMEENIDLAEPIISRCAALDYQTAGVFSVDSDPMEARHFLSAIADVHAAIAFFTSDRSSSVILSRAQRLLEAGVRRLQFEFRHLLTAEEPSDYETTALHDIAAAMISSGFGKECINTYKTIRRSVVAAELDRLGLERMTSSHAGKLTWTALEPKVRTWLSSFPVAVTAVFTGERALCDSVFCNGDDDFHISDACFAEVARDAAVHLISFPESVARTRRSPEKLFRLLDLYDTVSSLLDEVNEVFSGESTSLVRSHALSSLLKLGEAARATYADLETAIQKDSNKEVPQDGAVHPISRYVLNYTVFLSDYEQTLDDVFADFAPGGAVEALHHIVELLLRKLEAKAESYRDGTISELFRANNVEYIASKVTGSRLREILGEGWAAELEERAKGLTAGCSRRKWSAVMAAMPAAMAKESDAERAVEVFAASFEEACRGNPEWVTRELRESVLRAVVPAYRRFYWRCRGLLRSGNAVRDALMSPEEVRRQLNEVFSTEQGSSLELRRAQTASRPVSRAGSFASCFVPSTISDN